MCERAPGLVILCGIAAYGTSRLPGALLPPQRPRWDEAA